MGNGESRLAVDYKLLDHHITYGCNALHREWTPNALIAIDEHMYFEVVSSGYSKKHKCYFSNFTTLPAETFEMFKMTLPDNAKLIENEKTDYMYNMMGRDRTWKFNDEDETMESVERPIYFCSWLTEEDKVYNIDDLIGETMQDSGQQALDLCCKLEQPDTVYILGFDLSNNNGRVNNVYKNTKGYAPDYAHAVDSSGWVSDLNRIFDKYNGTEFIHVQDNKILDIKTITVKDFINMLEETNG